MALDVMLGWRGISKLLARFGDLQLLVLVKLPYTALADQKHGRRQCLCAWVGPQHAQKAKFLQLLVLVQLFSQKPPDQQPSSTSDC
jgi:hypothetical protein